jgi:uncharacterized membrane protein YdjX (TVP38/TMEM64 family)
MKDKKQVVRWIVLAVFIAVVVYLMNKYNFLKGYGPEDIRDFIQKKGILAPIVYVLLLSLLPLLLFPDSVLVIAGGMLFGLVRGTILTSIGSLIGGVIAFLISRAFGSKVVKKITKKDLVLFEKYKGYSGFFIILLLRLIPLFPFKVVSYSAGLTDMKLRDFCLATVIGSLPGIIVYTNLGDKANDFGSKGFYVSVALVVLLFVVSYVLKKAFENKE